jgi:hypothetical protein
LESNNPLTSELLRSLHRKKLQSGLDIQETVTPPAASAAGESNSGQSTTSSRIQGAQPNSLTASSSINSQTESGFLKTSSGSNGTDIPGIAPLTAPVYFEPNLLDFNDSDGIEDDEMGEEGDEIEEEEDVYEIAAIVGYQNTSEVRSLSFLSDYQALLTLGTRLDNCGRSPSRDMSTRSG